MHLCRGRNCGHYGRTTDWLGVESFKLNKNNTKRHLSCALGCASHRIKHERYKINNPNYQSISNAIWNLIHNPVNNAKTQELARVENEARIQQMPKNEDMLSLGEAMAEAIKIMTCVFYTLADANLEELLGIFPEEMCDPRTGLPRPDISSFTSSFYFGYTGRQVEKEWLSFLTTRGKWVEDEDGNRTYSEQGNRPVLLWADDRTITKKTAEKEMGFGVIEVYSSTLMINARYVEKALQVRYKHLPLGHRLVRVPDKGKKYDKSVDGKVHKVFITFSFDVANLVADGTAKINY